MNSRFFILRSLLVLLSLMFLPAKSFSTHLESRASQKLPSLNLSPAAQDALLNPPRSLSPTVRDELAGLLKKAAGPTLGSFLKSRFDQVSYRVSSAQLRSGNAIHFSAQGLSADHPHTKIVIEVFYKGGDQAVDEFYGRWFDPTTGRDGWIRRFRFPTADRAAHTNLKDERTEAFFWQKSEYYIEVWAGRKVKVFAQRVHAALETDGFYGFAKALLASAEGGGPAQQSRDERFMRAVKEGDLRQVDRLIRLGADAQGAPGDMTPLTLAVDLGHAKIVDSLLRAGADANAKDSHGRAALFKAVGKNHARIVKILLKAGARVAVRDDSGATLLAIAARNGNVNILRKLIKAGADVNDRRVYLAENPVYRTPLIVAARNNQAAAVIVLLNSQADPDLHGERGATPLMIAADKGQRDIAVALLARGANMKIRDDDGRTALTIAEAKGNENIVALLKDLRRNLRHDQEGQSRPDRRSDADRSRADSFGSGQRQASAYDHDSPRRNSIASSQYRQRDRVLVRKDLIAAGKTGDVGKLFYLIDADKGDVNVTDSGGNTPLMFAALHGHGSMVNALLNETSADVNKANKDGDSALLYAAQKGDDWTVNILVLAGADIHHKNGKGKTALNYAAEQGHTGIVHTLNEAGAR